MRKTTLLAVMALFMASATLFGQPQSAANVRVSDNSNPQADNFAHVSFNTIYTSACGVFSMPIPPGMTSHQISWRSASSVQGFTLLVYASTDGLSYSTQAASTTLTSSTSFSGDFNFVRMSFSSCTGSGAIDVDYFGSTTVASLAMITMAPPANEVYGVTAEMTATTSTSVIASAGSGVRNYITQCIGTNAHATVGTFIKILDGATLMFEGYAAAVGGGWSATFLMPLRGTAATAVNAQNVTTGADTVVSCSGYTGP